jgi:hypothetical protein
VLARYGGAVLAVFRPGDHGLPGLPDQYLVRVDASGADAATLAADLRALEPTAAGEHRVSSQRGLDLLVIASREAAAGADVGLNWVGSGAQFRDRETSNEAPTGTGSAGGPYAPTRSAGPPTRAAAPKTSVSPRRGARWSSPASSTAA